MAKETTSPPPVVKHPIFSLKIGELVKWDISSDGCFGIIVIAALGTACAVCNGGSIIPSTIEAIRKAVTK